jgi:4-carboxymuconolactone decarboxylase
MHRPGRSATIERVGSEAQDLLSRLAANDERSLQALLVPTPESAGGGVVPALALDRRTRGLVRLGALIAVDACTASLRWAVELASSTGVDDEAVLGALLAAASAAGSAQVVSSAPRLALALGFDLELDGWDGS